MTVVYIVRTHVLPAGDENFNRWQNEEHMAALLPLPGYLGVQRFVAAANPSDYLNVWRLAPENAFGTDQYDQASHTPWYHALRPVCAVHVDFGVEDTWGEPHGVAPWRDHVVGLVVERPNPATGAAGPGLSDQQHLAALAAHPAIAHVIRLDPLTDDPALARRSAPPSSVLLCYLNASVPERSLPPVAEGIERRDYRPLTPYLTPSRNDVPQRSR
jgi:hypothetical protein